MPWDKDTITRLIEVEAQLQNVDPRLAVAVAQQESSLDPNNPGDNGASRGVFHLQRKAAIDAGIDPAKRDDPAIGIFAGVKYLKQQLDRSKGHIPTALSYYNRGTPEYRGIGDPDYVYHVMRHYPEHPLGKAPEDQTAYRARLNKTFGAGTAPAPPQQQAGIVSRAASGFSPASAEAASPQGAVPRTRLEEIEAELARREGQAAQQPSQAATPSPPTARSTPEQDAAYRASRGQQEPATASQTAPAPPTQPAPSQAPPAPSPDPSATAGMRFQALPSITQLDPADRIQKTRDFERLKPELQEEFLRSEEPVAGGLAVGGGPVAQSQAVTDPAALLAMGKGQRQPAPVVSKPTGDAYSVGPGGRLQIAPMQSSASESDLSGANRPHEQGIPLSAVPAIGVNAALTAGGALAGATLGPVGSAAGAALGGSAATRINTALGLAPQEKPLLETPWANVYPSDLFGAIPLGVAGTTSAFKGTVRNLPGSNVAKHEMAAERLKALEQRTAPPVPSDVLWQKAGQSNTAIATADVWRTAGDVVRQKSRTPNLSADDPALKAAQDLLSLAKKHGGPVPIQELDDARRNLVPHLRDPDVNRLYGALIGDMDNAVTRGVPGAADLRGAIAATRKEHSLAELTDLWSDGKGMQKTSGDVTQVYGKRIRNQFENKMHEDKTFAGAFTPEELVDIRSTLRDVGKLTRIVNPESQGPIGGGLKWLGRIGAGIHGYTTGDIVTTGMALLATEGASAVMANAMQSKVGRWALREAIREGNGKMTHGSLAAIAALVAREAAPDAPASAPTP